MSVAAQFEAHASEDLSSPFYFNASHWRAMDGIVEGAQNREGIMILTGPTGSGKTMLMRAISDNLGEGCTPLFLQYASLNFREFVNFLHNSLNVGDEILDASNKAVALRKFLYAQAERGETAVVFVDEAQNLEPDVLRMLPKLACFDQLENGQNVGLQFMLTGGSELREVLEDSDLSEVRDAVARNYELRFFSREELKYFLEKRLAPLARMTPEPITDDAIEAVGKYTGGSPRLIGMICSHAMLFAAENPGRSIDESMIEEAAEALMIEPAENAFADVEEDSDIAGPFSSADIGGNDLTATREEAPEPFVEDDTPIANSVGDSYDDVAMDAAAMDEADEMDETPEMSEIADEMGMGLDVDEISDEIDEGDFGDYAGEAATVAASGSLLSRMKAKIPGGRAKAKTQVLGAGRKGGSADRAAVPTEKRKMKTRVAGQRQKQMKVGLCAAAVALIAGGVWMKRASITDAFASVKDTVSASASSAIDSVSSVAGKSAETIGDVGSSIKTSALDLTQPLIEPKPSAASSGWGAKVEVLQPIHKPDRSDSGGVKIPGAGVSMARGALDMVGNLLEAGASAAPESVQGAFRAASNDVDGLRRTVTTNGVSGEALETAIREKVAEADDLFKRQLYIAPRGGNAYDSYREALDLDANNEAALRGIENLRSFYAAKAEAARSKKQWDRAGRHFDTAIAIGELRSVR